MTADQKLHRRLNRKAERLNTRARDEAGPLFADQAPRTNATEQYWAWRRARARGVEAIGLIHHPGILGLECLQIQAMMRYARRFIPAETVGSLDAYAKETYPSAGYWYGFWIDVLAGKRVVYGYRRVQRGEEYAKRYPLSGGFSVAEDGVFQVAQPIAKEELYRLFPYEDVAPLQHDDNGVAALLEASLDQ